MYISVQRRRRKKEEEALQQSPRRAAHESCSDLGEKTLHSSLQVLQPALKGNGYWRTDWLNRWHALTTPMHNVCMISWISQVRSWVLGGGRLRSLWGNAPPNTCYPLIAGFGGLAQDRALNLFYNRGLDFLLSLHICATRWSRTEVTS